MLIHCYDRGMRGESESYCEGAEFVRYKDCSKDLGQDLREADYHGAHGGREYPQQMDKHQYVR